MKYRGALLLGLMLAGLAACQGNQLPGKMTNMYAPRRAPAYALLAPDLQNFQRDFNTHSGSVRLVYIVSAVCPECLRGMSMLGKALHDEQDNRELKTYIVYVPALGAKAKDIRPTISLVPGKYVDRYWDPHGAAGNVFEKVLSIHQFAWDVYMIYGPGQTWAIGLPPRPRFWMDQLNGLPHEHFLNAGVFATRVRNMLARANPKAASRDRP